MNPEQLRRQAAAMHDIVLLAIANRVDQPYVSRTLFRDLQVIHGWTAQRFYLVLRREDDYPTTDEITAVADAFGLHLETVIPEHYTRDERHPATNRRLVWRCVRLQWQEADVPGEAPVAWRRAAVPREA